MRASTFLVAASFLTLGLAALPGATAIQDPIIVCVREPCGPGLPEPVPTCSPTDKQTNLGVRIVRDGDCNHRIDVRFMECVWNGSWKTFGTNPAVVRVYTCDGPDQTTSASIRDPFPTCIREPCGPTIPPGPMAPCSTMDRTVSSSGVTVDLSAGCHLTVTVDIMDCVRDGQWHTTTVGPATVRVFHCGGA